ncbi:hypothetical protein [Corynebacterium rhinophilum]|uniref:hypothetical protein n=1 Tax=Corynebacterium rhinophilum TaxID=3050197 RepID=UPI00254BE43A|nr:MULTISPECIES: hypothetical protein [unclassified Corynebacterium]MDK8466682.1 hypothetical protein [Corynebacterium sp. MSK130]MDK8646722.1 hypothetical protein [Corynebacterium sp. MSK082]MDK8687256.1 hypothetical protein [Corynebacterium sp. MSK122]MDK8697465.1 hypothetical protein [Corynebacterium sp. MSK192]MDK8764722.1 hypothetical protein [Corynebacterium sp. MSK293]
MARYTVYFKELEKKMRRTLTLGSVLLATSLAITGCGSSGGPEKALKNAADEQMEVHTNLLEAAQQHQSGDSKKAEESAHEWVDQANEFQTDYLCKEQRNPVSPDEVVATVQSLNPSDVPSEEELKELKDKKDDALKDLEESDSSSDDEAYVTSDNEDFANYFNTSEIELKKEDGDWKVCDSSFQLF